MISKRRQNVSLARLVGCVALVAGCSADEITTVPDEPISAIETTFDGRIDLDNLHNYAAQIIPAYITKDNSGDNPVTDEGATLGRVLFYDTNLSSDRSIACASCHHQELAFGDDDKASVGVAGTTRRHSMRLINARFAEEVRFFWDERAETLEDQTTQPIQDHTEMGFSGENGDPSFVDLIDRLEAIDYYNELFIFVYGDASVTEDRIQLALGQFVRSIQSFDSRFDEGRAQVANDETPFPNFTARENMGKELFLTAPRFGANGGRVAGGFGCGSCHRAPEFDIDPKSLNDGIVGTLAGALDEFSVTRASSLRDVVNGDGEVNGGLTHLGLVDLVGIVEIYNTVVLNPNLDPRLIPGGFPQSLGQTQLERATVVAFLKTLSGTAVYTDEKWSDPFVPSPPATTIPAR